MRAVSGARPKALVPVRGTPMLARLLAAADAAMVADVYVVAPPGDRAIEAFLESTIVAARVHLLRRAAAGYLVDIVELADVVGDAFTVLDCDLVTPHGELVPFLGRSLTPAREFIVAVSDVPPSHDERSIRLAPGPDGALVHAPGSDWTVPRAVGAYVWSPGGLRRAKRFLARGAVSFHAFVATWAVEGVPVELVPMTVGMNVNTPSELAQAERYVGLWSEPAVGAGWS
jgi:molybdopterin-guanine dinucleotide biosynthesis protein A